jgi:conjugative transfer region protein TrbK
MDGKTLARIGAVVFVAVAIVATAIEVNRKPDSPDNAPAMAHSSPLRDPLDAELARCSGIGEAGPRDPSCLRAWADNRRRFLGQPAPAPSPASSAPAAPTTMFPSAQDSAEPATPAVQPEPSRTEAR